MRHLAIIGSGPSGYYTAEAAQKAFGDDIRVDVFDRLPVPYGLIRSGVAPDHQSIKGVSRRYEKVALSENVRFVGNVTIGSDISVDELAGLYDALVFATGAPHDRELGIPGAELGNVFGSARFVGWYNGHPEFARLAPDLTGSTAVVIGMGNVALDVARILSKTREEFADSDIVNHALDQLASAGIERIVLLGRRGPHQIMMTPKELGELGELARAAPVVDPADLPPEGDDAMLEPGLRKSVTLLRQFAAAGETAREGKPIAIEFAFFAQPHALIGTDNVEAIEVERTVIERGRAVGTGEIERLPADLVVSCIGYRSSPIPGLPFDERAGRFANDEGRMLPGIYCVGWARRGPTGTIGTNRPDGYGIVEKIGEDLADGTLGNGGKQGRAGFDALARSKGLDLVTFRDWKKIEQAEEQAARAGAPREKFVDLAAMMQALGDDREP
ncbi:pyridine nucleotide-disulfide oxidoreductase [Aurantiacibacter xanthus]|uniref:Pyridine nucleotide-disulfide oxidoreductase n=1 Tax=Aurantiacibacter xanthus TaxID=1784712 RepID=A0A3A1P543_9SPHN|nr:FAD-dependent oxidoreductase [Aurantiacibacter xanthus]RIV88579.1 pyridine nucleotide-disulfide oxidoreductase [Aurantiacibacter xanthus]